MRSFRIALLAICAMIVPLAIPTPSTAQIYISLSAPPMMPEYQQPPVSNPNYQWIPGYWAMGQYGYYWVPGTWVAAPQAGLLWTPGYWGYQQQQNNYAWNQGYWAPNVGYYGGVNYGGGYYGNGYVGGGWYGNQFRYNTAVTPVNTTYIRNVYINKTVIVRNVNRYGYNGPGGVRMHPDAQQLAWARERHVGLTPMQSAHIAEAQQDRNLYANINHGKPAAVVAPQPFSSTNRPPDFKPLSTADRTAAKTNRAKPVINSGPKTASGSVSNPAPKAVQNPQTEQGTKTAPNSKPPAKPAAPPQHTQKQSAAQPNGKMAPQSKPPAKPAGSSQHAQKPPAGQPNSKASQSKPALQNAPQGKATHSPGQLKL